MFHGLRVVQEGRPDFRQSDAPDVVLIGGIGNECENAEDDDDNHQFGQREAFLNGSHGKWFPSGCLSVALYRCKGDGGICKQIEIFWKIICINH